MTLKLCLSCIITMMFQTVCCQAQDNDREYWIDRYLSVSYPLEQIHVTSPYGKRKDPFTGKASHHCGIDPKARNEEVKAMFDGYVESIGQDSRSGRYIVLRHGNYLISYCHLSQVSAREGEELLAGDVVGITGNTGRLTGEHLHITCRLNGERIDPYTVLLEIRKIRKECQEALRSDSLPVPSKQSFIEQYAPIAIEQQQKYGIPASVTLAQMALESKWGTSKMAVNDHNYFGIKASRRWLEAGRPYSLYDDDKKNEKFCVFGDVIESIEYHSSLLMSERYKPCRSFPSDDWYHWLVSIKACGYATSNRYVQECTRIIKDYRLYRYDKFVVQQL